MDGCPSNLAIMHEQSVLSKDFLAALLPTFRSQLADLFAIL